MGGWTGGTHCGEDAVVHEEVRPGVLEVAAHLPQRDRAAWWAVGVNKRMRSSGIAYRFRVQGGQYRALNSHSTLWTFGFRQL